MTCARVDCVVLCDVLCLGVVCVCECVYVCLRVCARVCVQGRKQVCRSLLFIAFHCSHEEEEEAARHAGACLKLRAASRVGSRCAVMRRRRRLRRHCFSLQDEESASMLHA